MARISKEEILKRANDYIQFMIKEINENKDCFVECNKKSISDFEELCNLYRISKDYIILPTTLQKVE